MRIVDSQVNSFAPQTVPAAASYRFERLPSQQADADAQNRLEAMAQTALAKVGLQRHDAQASLTALVSSSQRVQTYVTDHAGWGFGWNMGWSLGGGSAAMGHGALFPGLDAQTSYWREVSLILRDRATQTVLFETHARHDGPWADGDAILPAMLDAALQGFPSPPAGVRHVNIEIPR